MLMTELLLLFPAQALLILGIQILELSIVLLLLKCSQKPRYDLSDFFHANKSSKQRSWLLASALGFGCLLSLVFITSYSADRLMGPKVSLFSSHSLIEKFNIMNRSTEILIKSSQYLMNCEISVYVLGYALSTRKCRSMGLT